MSIYNLGSVGGPAEMNPYVKQLMSFGQEYILNQQKVEGAKGVARAESADKLQLEANKAALEQKEKDRKYTDTAMQLAIDKIGREPLAKLCESEEGYKALWKKFNESHEEYKDIPVGDVLSSIVTVKEVEQKYQEIGEKFKADLDAGKKVTPAQVLSGLANMTYVAEMDRKNGLGTNKEREARYKQTMGLINQAQQRVLTQISKEGGGTEADTNGASSTGASLYPAGKPMFYGPNAQYPSSQAVGNQGASMSLATPQTNATPISKQAAPTNRRWKILK
jgi:hypothetical protein